MPNWNIDYLRIHQFRLFKQIMEAVSLSEAAQTLGITQSAASKQLNNLREHFQDELFVRTSSGMQPTEKANHIAPNIMRILDEIQLMNHESDFNPSAIEMRFVISTTDQVQHFLAPKLLELLEKQAPKVSLQFINLDNDYALKGLENGTVNMVVSVNWTAPETLVQSKLYEDPFVCLMSPTHSLCNEDITLQSYAKASHLMIAPLGHKRSLVDDLLAKENLNRDIRLILPNFLEVGQILEGANLLVTLPKRAASILMGKHNLRMKTPKFAIPSVTYYQFWHQRYKNDKARMWFFDQVKFLLRSS